MRRWPPFLTLFDQGSLADALRLRRPIDIRKDMTNLSAAQIEDFIHKGDARFARGQSCVSLEPPLHYDAPITFARLYTQSTDLKRRRSTLRPS